MATWDWRAWSLAVLAAVACGWFLFRRLAALLFRHVLLAGVAARHGWQVNAESGAGARARFADQERRRRRTAWSLLRRGPGAIREGYRTGVFGRTPTGAWHPELTITGTWRGRQFTASQLRRYEMSAGHEGVHRRTRRTASLHLTGTFPAAYAQVRWGRVTGQAPAPVLALSRRYRRHFRGLQADGGGLRVDLGPRLNRGRLLKALDFATEAATHLRRG